MRQETKIALFNILDTMTGADGGVRFIYLRNLVEEMDRRAEGGDNDAKSIIDVVMRFSRLIDVAVKTK